MINIILYLFVCLTNFYGFRAFFVEKNEFIKLWILFAMIFSFFMHVYEIDRFTKNLHIKDLKKDPVYNVLVFIDKLFAWPLIAFYIWNYYNSSLLFDHILLEIFAIIICVISTEIELSKENVYFFAVTHGIWHITAFHIAYLFSVTNSRMTFYTMGTI